MSPGASDARRRRSGARRIRRPRRSGGRGASSAWWGDSVLQSPDAHVCPLTATAKAGQVRAVPIRSRRVPHAGFVLVAILACRPAAPASAHAQEQATAGRVVATVTTLDGTVSLPGVQVELRRASDAMVLASTITDGSGTVTFPDVPPGRYAVRATRDGFLPADTAAFDVRANDVTRVLADIQLTFVMPPVDVR